MDAEMDALKENSLFDLQLRPTNKSVIAGKWVYNIKEGTNDDRRYKTRYVAKSYPQMENVDYQETFSYPRFK